MSADKALVDEIVGRVLQHLKSRPVDTCAPAGSDGGDLLIDEAVLTEESLAARLNGASSVRIARRTVLTPSALDFLRRQRINWSRSSAASSSHATSSQSKAIILDSTTSLDAAVSSGWGRETVSSVEEAVSAAISSICRADAERVAVFAKAAERIACGANRNERVCAAAIANAVRLASIIDDMAPNVVCLDPSAMGFAEVRSILRVFESGR